MEQIEGLITPVNLAPKSQPYPTAVSPRNATCDRHPKSQAPPGSPRVVPLILCRSCMTNHAFPHAQISKSTAASLKLPRNTVFFPPVWSQSPVAYRNYASRSRHSSILMIFDAKSTSLDAYGAARHTHDVGESVVPIAPKLILWPLRRTLRGYKKFEHWLTSCLHNVSS